MPGDVKPLIRCGYPGELPYPIHSQSEHVRELAKRHSLFSQLIYIGVGSLPFNQPLLFGSEDVGNLCDMILGLLGKHWSCTLWGLVAIHTKGIDQPELDEELKRIEQQVLSALPAAAYSLAV